MTRGRGIPYWTMSTTNGRRVAVTGLGFVTPIGQDIETVWSSLVEGVSGVGPITRFDASDYACRIAAEVKDYDAERFMDRKTARHIGRYCQFAVGAAKMALEDAGLDPRELEPDEVGVSISSGIGGMEEIERNHSALLERGVRRISPFTVPMMIADMAAGIVAMQTGAGGLNYAIVSACASSGHAIGEAAEIIKRGDSVAMIAGGAEATITPLTMGAFIQIKAVRAVFGDHAYKLAVSSTKSMHAHLLGGAGALEAGATILALERGVLPPTINLDKQDPECDLDYVPNHSRKADVKVAISNSFGFGGHNATLVIKKTEPN